MPAHPKYSLLEIERRWLVDETQFPDLTSLPTTHIKDKYLPDSRLRLRCLTPPERPSQFKLCKKYGRSHPTAEPIVNIYLTAAEYDQFNQMPGAEIEKMRYPLPNGHLDVYRQAAGKLFIFEVEFASLEDAAAYQPPPFVTKEITAVDHYTAAYLAMQQK